MFVRAGGDLLPSLDVRSRYRDFLPRHPDRLVDAEALREPGVRLHEQLIAHAIYRVHVGRRRHRASVPRIDSEGQSAGITAGCEAGWDPCMTQFGHVVSDERSGVAA